MAHMRDPIRSSLCTSTHLKPSFGWSIQSQNRPIKILDYLFSLNNEISSKRVHQNGAVGVGLNDSGRKIQGSGNVSSSVTQGWLGVKYNRTLPPQHKTKSNRHHDRQEADGWVVNKSKYELGVRNSRATRYRTTPRKGMDYIHRGGQCHSKVWSPRARTRGPLRGFTLKP